MEKLIILCPPGAFSKRDYDRFGIEFLKKNFSLKILNFTAWIYPELLKDKSNITYQCEEHISISCKDDFLAFDTEKDSLIVLDCFEQSKKINWVREQLRKRNSFFVSPDLNLLPLTKKNIFHFLRYLINFNVPPKKIFKFFQKRYYNLKKAQLPDILFAGGLASSKNSRIKEKISGHSMDYDVYLKLKDKPENKTANYAVFLDEDLVSHPDYIFNIDFGPPHSQFQYYSILLKFLKKFEMETNLKVKFAIHPKSHNNNLKNLLQDFDYSIGDTAELVKNSNVVLLHASTSISYAILFKKPAIFLTSQKLKKSWIGPRINYLAKTINSKVLNMDDDLNNSLNLQLLLKIDEHKYKNYLDQYLKTPNSPDIPLWEIFTKYIKSKQFVK
jgi:hypothetical protein|tara:strand:+ start:12660 stop:13817 length:1158 start_codon:yes stop_codon:yes gene_type:complete